MLNILACNVGGINFGDPANQMLPSILVLVINLIKIAIPIILIIFGMIDLAKAVMSNDEKEMKGAQTKLIKRVIYAVLVFLVISIVQLVFGALVGANAADENVSSCIPCFVTSVDYC